MLLQLFVTLAVVPALLAETNLRGQSEDLESFTLQGVPGNIGAAAGPGAGKLYAVCSTPLNSTDFNMRKVYAGLRTDFYKIIDNIIAGNPNNQDVKDTAPGSAVGRTTLTLVQQQYRVANLLGNAARLVFHDAGEVDIRTADAYGMDGCLSDTGPNAGLKTAETIAMNLMEKLFQKYCGWTSRADFWTLFGKIALESGIPTGRFASFIPAFVVQNTVGQNFHPVLNIPFQYGRKDAPADCTLVGNPSAPVARLPAHQPGLPEFTKTYVHQMGLTVYDGIILNGAHSVGHVHTQYSGFGFNDNIATLELNPLNNGWDETPFIFDNFYYDSLAGEFWLNANAQQDVIASPPNGNSGANFWAVQIVAGTQAPVPACAVGAIATIGGTKTAPGIPTCGVDVNNNIFCIVSTASTPTITGGITSAPTVGLPGTNTLTSTGNNLGWADFKQYMRPADNTWPCNCAQFFAAIQNPNPLNCLPGPHPKTQMLNSDMVQNFPNQADIDKTAAAAAPNAFKGTIGAICGPIVTNKAATNFKSATVGTPSGQLKWPALFIGPTGATVQQGFGCVKNTIGNLAAGNSQVFIATDPVSDPNVPSVSLTAEVQQFMTIGPLGEVCINGMSTYSGTGPYVGTVTVPLQGKDFIGKNALNGGLTTPPGCVPITPAWGQGRDNFYRAFEKAYVKMTTVGYSIDGVTRAGNTNKLGNLKSIVFINKQRNFGPGPAIPAVAAAPVSCTCGVDCTTCPSPAIAAFAGTPDGSSTCMSGEIC